MRCVAPSEVLEHMCHAAGIQPGETTTDGKLTIEFAECLGACEYAPCMLAGDVLHKNLTNESAEAFVKKHLHGSRRQTDIPDRGTRRRLRLPARQSRGLPEESTAAKVSTQPTEHAI